MVISERGVVLAACVSIACSVLFEAEGAFVRPTYADEFSIFTIHYSKRKFSWEEGVRVCNLSEQTFEGSKVTGHTLEALVRISGHVFQGAWVINARDQCLGMREQCVEYAVTALGNGGCLKNTYTTETELMGCTTRRKFTVICQQALITSRTVAPATRGQEAPHDSDKAARFPTFGSASRTTSFNSRVTSRALPSQRPDASPRDGDKQSSRATQAGSRGAVLAADSAAQALFTANAFLMSFRKGDKSLLGIIAGCMIGAFIVGSIFVALFCIYPRHCSSPPDAPKGAAIAAGKHHELGDCVTEERDALLLNCRSPPDDGTKLTAAASSIVTTACTVLPEGAETVFPGSIGQLEEDAGGAEICSIGGTGNETCAVNVTVGLTACHRQLHDDDSNNGGSITNNVVLSTDL